jgi:FixJ family two-component response regulator/predicted transcriptional regulator
MILVVDRDEGMRRQLKRLIETMKYETNSCGTMKDALKTVAIHRSIEVIIVNTERPEVDGIAFCKELAAVTSDENYVAPIITASNPSIEAIVSCMRAGAAGFLEQPLSIEVVQRELEALLRLVRRKRMRVGPKAHTLASQDSKYSPQNIHHSEFNPPSKPQLDARYFLKWRAQFRSQFKNLQWKEAYWDILLDLLTAEEDGVQSTLLSSYAAAQVPPSTAARYIKNLTNSGIVEVWQDESDKRRTNICLTEKAKQIIFEQMELIFKGS